MTRPKKPLADKFFETFPKRGTHGTKLDRLKASGDPLVSEFAGSVDELSRHMAQLLLEVTAPDIPLARSYERGYPTKGPASKIVRRNLDQGRALNPADATITKLS
jgi:hypothetical protein